MQPTNPRTSRNTECKRLMESWRPGAERCLLGFPDIVFATDAHGCFTHVGFKVQQLLGISSSDVCGRTFWDFVLPDDLEKARSMLSTPLYETFDTSVRIRDASGKPTFVRVRAKPFGDSEGRTCGYRGLLLKCETSTQLAEEIDHMRRSLARKKRTIRDLNEHVAQGEQLRAVATHIAEIAHELKQPLTIIGGFARRMANQLRSCENLDPGTKPESFAVIERELSRLEEMLVGLIGITRAGNIHYEEVDPNEMVGDVLTVAEDLLETKFLTVDHNLDEPIETVRLDPHLFEHVVRNLLVNAVEASPEENTISVRTRLVHDRKNDETGTSESYFELQIGNQGDPISQDIMDKIFEPFYTTKSGGSGIGLTLARHVVAEHHGSISVRSDAEGTVFTVRVPMDREKVGEKDSQVNN